MGKHSEDGKRTGMAEVTIGPYSFNVSSPDRVIFPDSNITKGDLVAYYRDVAEVMLPHVQGRPVTIHRFPHGLTGQGFYVHDVPRYFPQWVQRVSVVEKTGQKAERVVPHHAATLAYLASQSAIAIHGWLSRADRLNNPDLIVFDLDPPDNGFEAVRRAALHLRWALDSIGLLPYVMTTGSRGLHVAVPLDRSEEFEAVRAFAQELAGVLARQQPDLLTAEQRKAQRGGRVYLDTVRNSYGVTSVAPYSLRARPGAPVATPLAWEELADPNLHSQSYNIGNIFSRLAQRPDPWRHMWDRPCSLLGARQHLASLGAWG